MGVGALMLAGYFGRQGIRLLPRERSEWRTVVVLGLPNILGWHALSIIGVAHLPAGRAAILGFTMPVWTVLLGVLLYRDKLTPRLVLAVVAVLTGIALLLWNEWAHLAGRPVGIAWMQGAARPVRAPAVRPAGGPAGPPARAGPARRTGPAVGGVRRARAIPAGTAAS